MEFKLEHWKNFRYLLSQSKSTKSKVSKMKLKKIVLMAVKGDRTIRKRIKEVLGISEPTLYRILTENDDDLTKAAVMQVIREETGLSDSEILEEEGEVERAKV